MILPEDSGLTVRPAQPDDVPHLVELLGRDWIERTIRLPEQRNDHPLRLMFNREASGWQQWLGAFDEALGRVLPILSTAADGRDRRSRTASKLRDARSFWATVPELWWASKLMKAGAAVEIEPEGAGPDLRAVFEDVVFWVEVYSPSLQCDAFEIASDIEFRLRDISVGHDITLYLNAGLRRTSENVVRVEKALRHTFRRLAGVESAAAAFHVTRESVVSRDVSIADLQHGDGDFDESVINGSNVLLTAVVRVRRGLGGIVIGTHPPAETYSPHAESKRLVSDLHQLRRDASNVLVVDSSREFVDDHAVERILAAPKGPFARHPELAGVVLSRWGLYSDFSPDAQVKESYRFLASQNPATSKLPTALVERCFESPLET